MVEYNGVSVFIDDLVQVRDPDYGVLLMKVSKFMQEV